MDRKALKSGVVRVSRRVIWGSLAGLLASTDCAAQPHAKAEHVEIVINVIRDHSDAVVRLNGIPIAMLSRPSAPGFGPVTSGISTTQWAINGTNTVTVDAKPHDNAPNAVTTVRISAFSGSFEDLNKPPLFAKTSDGTGSAATTITVKDAPHFLFSDAEHFTGDKAEVIAAVSALHAAYAKKDFKTVDAVTKPSADDLGKIFDGPVDQMVAESDRIARGAKVLPLPPDLKVDGFFDNRIFVVSGDNDAAPIVLQVGKIDKQGVAEQQMETGRYWVKLNGKWLVIRQGSN